MHKTGSRKAVSFLACLSAAALVAACGGSSSGDAEPGAGSGPVPEPSEPVTITFSSWVGSQPDMKALAEQFHEEHPKITVEFQNVPAEKSTEKLTTQVAGGNPPDVAYIDASATAAFASREALVNLDNYIERSDIVDADAYVDSFKTFTTYEGSLYGLPFDGESTGLFYRTDLFEAAGIDGPPKTWEEFESAAQALTDGDKQYGIALFAPESAYYWYPWLWQAGGDLLSEDGDEVLFDSEEAKQAAEYYVGLTEYAPPDYLNSDSYDGRVAFANGQVGMYVAGAWFAGVLADEFPDLKGKWDTAPLPEGPEGCATTIAGDSLVVFEGSENPDAAWKWVEFLSKPENLAAWTYKGVPGVEGSGEGTLLPPLKPLLESEELVKEKPVLEGFADSMECGVSHVVADPNWGRIEEALNGALGKAMYGEISPAEALDSAASEAEQIIAD
jgi:multiple sugar transport system substrate-binding protein